jgi:non-ribosomal peptide synthase protein (TIGR01720 family)
VVGGSSAAISFNYHGQFDVDRSGSGPFAPARESTGATQSVQARRTHLLALNSQVTQGRLYVSIAYSEEVHAQATIERLAQNYLAALRELIAHCKSPEAGGYTPSDFPEATISQKSLNRLLSGMRKK